jgi:putative hemolysin
VDRLILVLGISLSVSFLCSVLEAVFLSVTHSWVGVLKERGKGAGVRLDRMLRRIDEPIGAILTLNTIAHTVGAAMGGSIALEVFGDQWIALFSAVLTLLILVFSEIIPKTLGAAYWKSLSVPSAYVLACLVVVLRPVLVPLSWFNRLIQPQEGKRVAVSRAEIEVLAELGRREGVLGEGEWNLVRNVLGLRRVAVGDAMTPRTDIVGIPVDASVEEAMDLMLHQGHLRLPVYERDLDHIVGLLAARDLWAAARSGETKIRAALRPMAFAPAGKPVEDLISEMRAKRSKMIIVLDEFGGTAGLVTLEDLIEEIVGDIRDEHEPPELEDFQRLETGEVLVGGNVLVRDANETLSLDLPDAEADTVGGFVFGRLGRVPRVGDEVHVEGGTFRVGRLKGLRIESLLFLQAGRDGSGYLSPSEYHL